MLYKLRFFVMTGCCALALAGCRKDAASPGNSNALTSFSTYIAGDSITTIFNTAFQRSELASDSAYMDNGPYTVFVPVDSAFKAQGLSLNMVNTMDRDSLKAILRYLFVKGRISGTTMPGFFKQSAATLAPQRPILTKNYYGIFFNGIAMQQANISLGDAMVHKMKRVALVTRDSVRQVIASTPELSIFSACIDRIVKTSIGYDNSTVINLLATNGKTVFAPTNEAMRKYGFPSEDFVRNVKDSDAVALMVKCQVYTGPFDNNPNTPLNDNRTFSCTVSDFIGGYQLSQLGGVFLSPAITVREDGYTIFTPLNLVPPKIVKTDLLAVDGVVQETDQVLLIR